MAAITPTTVHHGQVFGSFKVTLLTFTSSGTTAANVTDTLAVPFKHVFHVVGVGSALVGPAWSFSAPTLSLTVNGGTQTSVAIFGD